MTQKEIEKFLANTKVYTNGKNKEILKKLFQFGYTLFNIHHEYEYNKDPFMFIWPDKKIGHGCDMTNFIYNDQKEITVEEILSLELTEPTYRPFKDKEECWNEMLKHQPFGWIKNTKGGGYYQMGNVHNKTDFKDLLRICQFADGTPFGIKED